MVKVVNIIKKKMITLKIFFNKYFNGYALMVSSIFIVWRIIARFEGFNFDFWFFSGKCLFMVLSLNMLVKKLNIFFLKEIISNNKKEIISNNKKEIIFKRQNIVIRMDSYEERDLDSVSDLELKKNYLNKKQEVYNLRLNMTKRFNENNNKNKIKLIKALQEYYELKEEISKKKKGFF